MSAEIATVKIANIDPNPMRQLTKYPYNEKKIEALRRSIQGVGLWESVIVRKVSGRYQAAFGHHRIEASRIEFGKEGRIPVIVRDLTDEQMLQFMGRENLEDYNADFLVMLETWEAAIKFKLSGRPDEAPQPIEVGILLGWTRPSARGGHPIINDTAEATNAAAKLIAGGYIKREQLEGLPVGSVRELCGRVVAHHEMLERMAKQTQRPPQEVEGAKRASGRAAGRVAKDVRAGRTARRDIRGQVDREAYAQTKDSKRQTPLFAMFGQSLADQVSRVVNGDVMEAKFKEIKAALGKLTEDKDVEIVKRIGFECERASERFDKWSVAFENPKAKVVKLREIS